MTKLVSKTRAWKKVAAHYKHFKDVEMRDLFDDDKKPVSYTHLTLPTNSLV